jgi:hypothetical protein
MPELDLRPSNGSLQRGADRLDAVVRDVRARQRAITENVVARSSVLSPSEVWSKKFLSQGIGPDTSFAKPIACFEDGTCLPPRNQLMHELKARASGTHDAKIAPAKPAKLGKVGDAPMRKPFAPEKPKRKHSWLARLFLG